MLCRFEGDAIVLRSLDGSFQRRLELPAGDRIYRLCLSPDDTRLALSCGEALHVRSLDDAAWALAREGVRDFSWFPDGERLAVCCEGPSVASIRPDGTDQRTHYSNRRLQFGLSSPAVSPDGTKIAFLHYKGAGTFRVALSDLATGDTELLHAAHHFAWLDPGRLLITTTHVHVLDAATGKKKLAIRGDASAWSREEVALVQTRLPHVHDGRVYYVQDTVLEPPSRRCVRQVRSLSTELSGDRLEAEAPNDHYLIGYYPIGDGGVLTSAARPAALPDARHPFGGLIGSLPDGYSPLPRGRGYPLAHGPEHWAWCMGAVA